MDQIPAPDNEVPQYQLSHTAPVDDGYSKPISQLPQMFGPDVYDHPHFYGTADAETMAQLHKVKEDPEAELTIYRAVPPEHREINTGDWITLSHEYAMEHSYDLTSGGDGVIISATVPAASIFTDGNDLAEFGYAGKRLNLAPQDTKSAGDVQGLGVEAIASRAPEETRIIYIRNSESSQNWKIAGDDFKQSLEPAGRYLNDSGMDSVEAVHLPDERWEAGTVTFKQPLFMEWGESGSYNEPDNWKQRLSAHYNGSAGEELSRLVAAEGYDAIITHDSYGSSEIVDLTHLHQARTTDAKTVDAAQLQKALEAQKFAQSQQLHPIGHAASGKGKSVNQVKATAPQKAKAQSQQRSK